MKAEPIKAPIEVETPCPACGEQSLRIEFRLTAKPTGTYSVSGAQPKVVATLHPWLVCGSCAVETEAKA